MSADQMLNLLRDSGLNVRGTGHGYIFIEDPTCFTVGLSGFIEYAWIAIAVLTAFLMMGWAFSLIRGGSKLPGIANNFRNLVIIFGTLTAAGPIMNFVYGGDLWGRGCRIIGVPASKIQELLDLREAGLGGGSGNMWEKFDIWDSRALTETVIPEDWFIAPDVSELEAGRDGIIVIEPDRRIAGGRAGPGIGADAASNARQVFAQNRMQVRTGAGAPGASRDGGRRRHEGRDLNVSAGTPIASFFDGTVHRVYGAGGQGGLTFVEIRNNDGTLAVYGYVQPNLRAGQPVSAGQVFGTVQDLRRNPRYRDTPNHVHFELWTGGARRQGNFIDIASLL
ncbi:MAG: M23 family metallopeptidase [Alphaproteobacteria bacterium]|nr:M23 family metallopeptidase [Alphaproteobacteria bacterium]